MEKTKLFIVLCLWVAGMNVGAQNSVIPELKRETLTLQSADHKFKLSVDGRIQIDGALFHGEDYQPVGNGVSFRRVRLGTDVAFGEHLSGKIEVDFANGNVGLKDTYIQYKFFKGLSLRAGNFKEAYSMETMTSSNDLLFLERANAVSAFAPDRHIGLQGNYHHGSFLGVGGVHFRQIDGSKEKANSDAANKAGYNEGFSVTGRAVWMPHSSRQHKGLHFGLAASYRTPTSDASADSPHSIDISSPSLSGINKIKFLDTGVIADVNHNWLVGAEFAAYYRAFRLQSEYMQNNTVRNDNLPTEKFNGYYVQAGYLLFGGNQRYNSSRGAFSQPQAGRKWGDVELAARFDRLDLNGKTVKGGEANNYTIGVNYYLNRNFKVQLNYSYLMHDKYANAYGDALVGKDENGKATSNPDEEMGSGGNDFSSWSIRLQLKF